MMKQKKWISLLTLLLSFSLLTGCAASQTDGNAALLEEKAEAEMLAESYLARIAELESTLQQEKEDRYIRNSQYEQRIRELEETLKALSASTGGDTSEEATLVFHYRLQNGNAVITGYEGNHPFVTVPATLDGYPVYAIGERAFENKSVAAVVLPEGLQVIEWFAFYGCASLVDLSLPASVTEIGHAVFDGCPQLTLVCAKNSYGEEYAKSYGLSYILQ